MSSGKLSKIPGSKYRHLLSPECGSGLYKSVIGELVKSAMESAAKLTVPLVAEVHIGPNWLEAK
jgi:hypothetical protein